MTLIRFSRKAEERDANETESSEGGMNWAFMSPGTGFIPASSHTTS